MKCPTCGSPNPGLHPSMQHEGEVELCGDPFHKTTALVPGLEEAQRRWIEKREGVEE